MKEFSNDRIYIDYIYKCKCCICFNSLCALLMSNRKDGE